MRGLHLSLNDHLTFNDPSIPYNIEREIKTQWCSRRQYGSSMYVPQTRDSIRDVTIFDENIFFVSVVFYKFSTQFYLNYEGKHYYFRDLNISIKINAA